MDVMMRRFQWMILFVVFATVTAAGQDTKPAAIPSIKLTSVTLLVRDYDKATKWYSEMLGFEVRDNKDPRPERRWVMMYSKANPDFRIFLHKPGNGYMPVSKNLSWNRIGKETFWIIHTPDFEASVNHLKKNGVRFRSRSYDLKSGGKEIVFEDLYGNLWVLQQVEVKKPAAK